MEPGLVAGEEVVLADDPEDLGERLWASVEGTEREKLERAWAEEVERRIDEIEGGRVEVVEAERVVGPGRSELN